MATNTTDGVLQRIGHAITCSAAYVWYGVFFAIHSRIQTQIRKRSVEGSDAFLDPTRFPLTNILEVAHPKIRIELDQLLKHLNQIPTLHTLSAEQKALGDDDRWKAYFFMTSGHHFSSSMERCPETTRALLSIPGVHTAFFSFILPGRTIPPHFGPYCGCVRFHLGVAVPEPELCGIEVRGEQSRWQEGRVIAFDDSYIHSVWNHGSQVRVVLIVDVVRTIKGALWRYLNNGILGMIARGKPLHRIIQRYAKWESSRCDSRRHH